MSLAQLYLALLAGGLVLVAAVGATRLAARAGLPSLLLFLALGVALGEDGLGIRFDDAQLAQNLGIAALAVILVEGGLSTRWTDVRPVLAPAGALAVVGVAASVGITASGAHLLLGLDWQLALLVGAILSSTDAAAVFAVLRDLPVPRRLAGVLEAESGFNDAPTVILVALFATASPGAVGLPAVLLDVGYQLTVGTVVGLAVGRLGVAGLRRVALPATGLYPVAAFGLGILAFAAAGTAQASGFVAAYLAALIMGNAGLPHRVATRSFAEGLGWLAQMGLFVLLGLLITPSDLPAQVLPAVVIGALLVLVARPISVVVCLTPFRIPWRQQAFTSWAGLRGAVPIVLATIPVVAGLDGSERILDIVFVAVVVFTLVQGPSLPPLARLLGLTSAGDARDVAVEVAPLDTIDADLLTLTVPGASRLPGVALHELRLPAHAVVPLIVRRGEALVPGPETRLAAGDHVLIVAAAATREATERRLRAVGRRGRLARWFGEHGDPDAGGGPPPPDSALSVRERPSGTPSSARARAR